MGKYGDKNRQSQTTGNGSRTVGGDDFSTSDDYGSPRDFSQPVAKGPHVVQVIGLAVTTSKSSGNPMLAARFVVIGPTDKDHKRYLFENYVLLQNAGFPRLQQLVLAIDSDIVGCKQDPENGFDPRKQDSVDQLMGAPVIVVVSHHNETWQGKQQVKERIAKYTPVSDALYKKLAAEYGESCGPDLPADAYTWKRGNATVSTVTNGDSPPVDDEATGLQKGELDIFDDIPF